jgi:hypothetical protein
MLNTRAVVLIRVSGNNPQGSASTSSMLHKQTNKQTNKGTQISAQAQHLSPSLRTSNVREVPKKKDNEKNLPDLVSVSRD